MRTRRSFVQLVTMGITLAVASGAQMHCSMAQEVLAKAVIRVDGTNHSYDLFVPDREKDAPSMPLLVAVHGAGGDGLGQIKAWLPIARANKMILLAPNIDNSPQAWDMLYDHPEWIRDAIDSLSQTYPVDKHRLYLWGYSAGGMFTFYFAFLESRYFAAAAVHGGVIENFKYQMADFAVRKIPLAYYLGTGTSGGRPNRAAPRGTLCSPGISRFTTWSLPAPTTISTPAPTRSLPMPGSFSSDTPWTTNLGLIRWT